MALPPDARSLTGGKAGYNNFGVIHGIRTAPLEAAGLQSFGEEVL